jgi:hypothetical protein
MHDVIIRVAGQGSCLVTTTRYPKANGSINVSMLMLVTKV